MCVLKAASDEESPFLSGETEVAFGHCISRNDVGSHWESYLLCMTWFETPPLIFLISSLLIAEKRNMRNKALAKGESV